MQSDLLIPRAMDILDRALDYRESALRTNDAGALGQIDRLVLNVAEGAAFAWQLGVLHVASPSGATYHVSRACCDCPNGRAGRRACWHWTAFNVLLDMIEEEYVR